MSARTCPVCFGPNHSEVPLVEPTFDIACLCCGTYKCTAEAGAVLGTQLTSEKAGDGSFLELRLRTNISGFLWENPGYLVTVERIESLRRLTPPPLHERADKLLIALEKVTKFLDEAVSVNLDAWRGRVWCANSREVLALLKFLHSENRVSYVGDSLGQPFKVTITPAGWARLEKLRETNPTSAIAFVAMRFSDAMLQIYNQAIYPAIRKAGFEPVIVPAFQPQAGTDEYTEDILSKILMLIRRSRFVVADFTEPSNGTYFEAGFAKGLGRPVLWACRKDCIEGLHFDISHYDHIDWKDAADLEQRLHARIEAILGHGPSAL